MMETYEQYRNKSSRDAYGIAFYQQAKEDQRIVAVTADVPESVRFDKFRESWPERYFNFGIAEQNMMGAAAGICPTHSGISLGQAGPSHHSIEDISIMRSIFNMLVVAPADGIGTAMAMDAIKGHNGPVYMRLSRAVEPTVYKTKAEYAIGKANVLRTGLDISIIAFGASVGNAMLAAQMLAREGIQASVLDMAFIKPIDKDAVINAANSTGKILTVEEHTIVGGLGSAVAEVIAESNLDVSFARLALPDQYTLAGSYPDLQEYYSLNPKGIAEHVRNMLRS
jgi:transketolase